MIFSIIFGILAINNYKGSKDKKIQAYIDGSNEDLLRDDVEFDFDPHEYPGFEYKHLSLFLSNIIRTIRFSLGDFEFGSIIHLN